MPDFKYYDAINVASAETKQRGTDLRDPFDISVLGKDSGYARFYHRVFDLAVKCAFRLLRKVRPVARFGRLIIVSRAEDVRKILADTDHFEVPFGPEMTELAGGANFVLGQEDAAHGAQRDLILKIVLRSDVPRLGAIASDISNALISNAKGRIDVISDLFTRVSTEVCFAYFGLSSTEPEAFADWTLSISALLFADPFGNPTTRALALKGAVGVRGVIDRSRARAAADDDTLLGRLTKCQLTDGAITDAEIGAILLGLATGLIPTTTLAAGRIVDELLRRPDAWQLACESAIAGDKAKLKSILFEAARLNPALSPGQWRYTRKRQVIVESSGRQTEALEGSIVLVATASALVDEANLSDPLVFRTDRPEDSYALAFGMGLHECIGKWVAMEIITEVALALFPLSGLKRAKGAEGRLGWCGPFPRRLDLVFEPQGDPVGFAMPTFCIPLPASSDSAKIKASISVLGNPALPEIKAAADQVGTLHFVSASLLELGSATDNRPHIVIEANADGDDAQATRAVAAAFGPWLGPIVAEATGVHAPFAEVLNRYRLKPETFPIGTTGLMFPGLPDFSTRDIERQAKLADFAREATTEYLRTRLGHSARALDVLAFVRALIRPDAAARRMIATDQSGKLGRLAARGAEFASVLLLPGRRRLALMDWSPPSAWQIGLDILKDPSDLISIKAPYYVCAIIIFFATLFSSARMHAAALDWRLVRDVATAFVIGAVGALALIALALIVILIVSAVWLRHLESSDAPDNREPSLEAIRIAAAAEDAPGFAQNHFTSVSDMKPGVFRRLTLATALWGVRELVCRFYRPGFVIDLGTINFARWLRPEGTNKLVFFSNFDGSWHSYLEDFITKAHAGQSAVWSNGVGFPRTSWLINQGAEDGDRFKRWVRRQQVVTQFWYARFATLAADIKRANGVIHFGLARASDETEARDWLSQFGSIPRPAGAIESEEAQSIVFRAFGGMPFASYAIIRLPEDQARLQRWLINLVGGLDGVPADDPALQLAFGDRPETDSDETTAACVAFSAIGLVRAGFPGERPGQKSTSFPSAFNLGMSARSRVLGDLGENAPSGWQWSDGQDGVDAMLIIYGRSEEACERTLAGHEAALGHDAILHRIVSRPTDKGIGHEPFGFRDGISQPVLKGTRRHAKGAPERDVLEPGEFLLGYPNSSGYYPLTPTAPAICDPGNRLPTLEMSARPDLPSLDTATAMRDFGRNGTFLAVRQFRQDVDGFHAQAESIAAELAARLGIREAFDAPVTPELVEAKMMGRRQDGSPLMGAVPKTGSEPKRPSNDFDFASDDPEGVHCPIGSHIRRANPRAGLSSSSVSEEMIVARHRLLRRGRPYLGSGSTEGKPEWGLMFIALCADIERQFEFVQQSWLNNPGFLSLRDEPDPVIGADAGTKRTLTLPTPLGPICLDGLKPVVQIRGGGYFFAPSQSALAFLADASKSRTHQIFVT